MQLIFAWHIDVDDDIERALMYDKSEEAARLSQGLERGTRILESWVLRSHGRMLGDDGCAGSAQLEAEYLEELPDILRQVEEATGARMFVGVGAEPSEAIVAKKVARDRGGDPAVTLYTPDLSEEARQIDEMSDDEADAFEVGDGGGGGDDDTGLAKAEDNQQEGGEATQIARGQMSPSAAAPSPPPSPGISAGSPSAPQGPPQQGAQPQPEDEDVMGAIGQALEAFKAQVPFFEQQVKQANPQAYQAVMGMVQGLIALAQQVAGGDGEGTPPAEAQQGGQPVAKSETSKVEFDPARPIPPEAVLRKLYAGDDVEKGEVSPTDAHYREFKAGFEHEAMEHPHLDAQQAALTAKQHLAEDPQYYSKLGLLEESGVIGEGSAPLNKVVLPVGSRGVGPKGNSVKVAEPVTGEEKWHQMGAGIRGSGDSAGGGDGAKHAISTLVSACGGADTPEARASKAGLVGAPTTAESKPPQTAQLPGK